MINITCKELLLPWQQNAQLTEYGLYECLFAHSSYSQVCKKAIPGYLKGNLHIFGAYCSATCSGCYYPLCVLILGSVCVLNTNNN